MSQSRISKKIRILRHEGTPQRQAVATALAMEKSGRIGSQGQYLRTRQRKSKRQSNDKFYRKVVFLIYTEMVPFRPQS